MEITVGAKLKVSNPTNDMIKWCRSNLIIDNPDYFKKERMGKWTGNTPKNIFLFETVGTDLYLPFGCLQDLWRQYGRTCSFQPVFRAIERINYHSSINLYSYQERAAEAIFRAKNGVVVMPCGSGKTQTALEAVSRIGGRTLWLTHTQDLMNQSMNRAKSCLEIDSKTFGTITGGKVNIGTSMTFATVQTMSKIDLRQYRDAFDVVIVDECHHTIGSPTRVMQFYKVLSSLTARYKIGLTATPKRADGLEKSMFALLGGIICEISKEEVKHFIEDEFGYDLSRTCDEIRPTYHHVESCQGTVPEAIIAFLESTDFEDAIRNAVSLGGDCDTLTCITGGLAEAFYGVPDDLKQECISRLPDEFLEVIDQFYVISHRRFMNSGEEDEILKRR